MKSAMNTTHTQSWNVMYVELRRKGIPAKVS